MKKIVTYVLSCVLVVSLFFGVSTQSDAALVLSNNLRFYLEDYFRSEVMNKYWSITSKSLADGSEKEFVPSGVKVPTDYYVGDRSLGDNALAATQENPSTKIQLGKTHDVRINFTCPASGTVQVSYLAKFGSFKTVTDGFSSAFYINGEMAWPENKTPIVHAEKKDLYEWTNFEVKAGDVITLELCGLSDRSDDTIYLTQYYFHYINGDNFYQNRSDYKVAVIGDVSTAVNDYTEFMTERMNASTKRFYKTMTIDPYWGSVLSKGSMSSIRNSNAAYLMLVRNELNFVPDCVLLCVGVRDASYEDFDKEKYLEEYSLMIKDLRKLNKDVKIYILTSPYAKDKHTYQYGSSFEIETDPIVLHNQIVPLQRQLAKEENCGLIDLFSFTKDLYEKTGKTFVFGETRKEVAEYLYNALCCDTLPGLTSKMATYEVDLQYSNGSETESEMSTTTQASKPTSTVRNDVTTNTTDSELSQDGTSEPAVGLGTDSVPMESEAPSSTVTTEVLDLSSSQDTERTHSDSTISSDFGTSDDASSSVLWVVLGCVVFVAVAAVSLLLRKKKN